MNLKQIECFNALAKTLNFTKSAEAVYITQPAFSRMIASLEEELGCKLIIRSKTEPTKLTLAGERILENTRRIERDYTEMFAKAKLAKSGQLGRFRIGILPQGLTDFTSGVIRQYRVEYPNVAFELKEFTEVGLCRALEEDLVDAALLLHTPELYQNRFEYLIMETSHVCLIMAENHPLAQRQEISPEELANESFVAFDSEKSELGYNQLMHICLKEGFVPQIAAYADSISSLLYYVKCNMGVTILTDMAMEIAGKAIRCVPLKNQEPCHHMLMWKKGNKRKELKLFIQTAQKEMA